MVAAYRYRSNKQKASLNPGLERRGYRTLEGAWEIFGYHLRRKKGQRVIDMDKSHCTRFLLKLAIVTVLSKGKDREGVMFCSIEL